MRNSIARPEGMVFAHYFEGSTQSPIGGEAFMFSEDVHMGVMPIIAVKEKYSNFTVSTSGVDAGKATALLSSLCSYDRGNLRETLCEVVNELAHKLSHKGSAAFEVNSDDASAIKLINIPNRGLYRFPGFVAQLIPANNRARMKRSWSIAKANRVWFLDMPDSLGGRRDYQRILRGLTNAQTLGPSFFTKDIANNRYPTNFNFTEYVRDSEIECRKLTKIWGWNRRDWHQERSTEFYVFYQAITFRLAQAKLRDHIVEQLNMLFARVGIAAHLSVAGLPTQSEILKIRNEMCEGLISFSQAYDSTSLW